MVKRIFSASVVLILSAVAATVVAAPKYDDFNTSPDQGGDWSRYDRTPGWGGAIDSAWNGVDALNLSAAAVSWEGLFRGSAPYTFDPAQQRTPTDPVTLLVKSVTTTATNWSLVGLTISQEIAPAYNSSLPEYTFIVGSDPTNWLYQVKGINNENLYTLSSGIASSAPLTNVKLDIVRDSNNYLFKVNGTTLFSDNAVTRFGSASAANSLVNYSVQYGAGTGLLTAVVDNYGVPQTVPYAATVVASSPLVYYRMQETSGTTAFDSGPGTQQNGTYAVVTGSGGPGPQLNQPGPTLSGTSGNRATTYNGLSSDILVAGTDFLDATTLTGVLGEKFSVEFWFKNTRPDSDRLITGYLYSRSNTGFLVGIDGNYNGEGLAPSKMFLGIGGGLLVSNFDPTENTWYHLVATYNQTDSSHVEACLYVDGAKILDGIVATSQLLADTSNIFGVRGDGQWAFQGSMAEVALYNSVLSQADVTAHYNAAVVPEPSTLVLLAAGLLGLLTYVWRKRK